MTVTTTSSSESSIGPISVAHVTLSVKYWQSVAIATSFEFKTKRNAQR